MVPLAPNIDTILYFLAHSLRARNQQSSDKSLRREECCEVLCQTGVFLCCNRDASTQALELFL